MLTLSVLAAESQAVLRLGGSRVMVINNTDKKGGKRKRARRGKENYTMNTSNKYVDLDKKGNEIFMQRRRGRKKKKSKKAHCTLKIFFRACLKPEMSHFSLICF